MLTVLDIALADARILAYRIINQDNQGDIVAGATKLNLQRGGLFLCLEQHNRPIGNCFPIQDHARAIADQIAPQQVYQGANQRGRGSALLEQAMAVNQGIHGAPPRSNPYHPKAGAPAIANPYSLEEQRQIDNAIAMAAHAIREGARALAEGTSYEPKPPMFELDTQWANAFPETLHIGSGTMPDGMHKLLAVGKYKWVRKPTQSQPGTPEIGRSNAQIQCSPLSLSFCQTKHPTKGGQKLRVNVPDHQEQTINQKQLWTFVQAPGVAQDKNRSQKEILTRHSQERPRQPLPRSHPSSQGNRANIWFPKCYQPVVSRHVARGPPPLGKVAPPIPEY